MCWMDLPHFQFMAGLITNGEKCCKGSYRATCVKTGMQEVFDLLITKIKIKQKPPRQFSTNCPFNCPLQVGSHQAFKFDAFNCIIGYTGPSPNTSLWPNTLADLSHFWFKLNDLNYSEFSILGSTNHLLPQKASE